MRCIHGRSDEEVCLPCAMVGPVPRDETRDAADDAVVDATARERARCRSIVMRLFGNDWKGNDALAEIDGGKVG